MSSAFNLACVLMDEVSVLLYWTGQFQASTWKTRHWITVQLVGFNWQVSSWQDLIYIQNLWVFQMNTDEILQNLSPTPIFCVSMISPLSPVACGSFTKTTGIWQYTKNLVTLHRWLVHFLTAFCKSNIKLLMEPDSINSILSGFIWLLDSGQCYSV